MKKRIPEKTRLTEYRDMVSLLKIKGLTKDEALMVLRVGVYLITGGFTWDTTVTTVEQVFKEE